LQGRSRGDDGRSEHARGDSQRHASIVSVDDSPQPEEIQHVYIHDAVHLRPDLSKLPPVDWMELENWINEQMAMKDFSHS
jgi:hypothetical protein